MQLGGVEDKTHDAEENEEGVRDGPSDSLFSDGGRLRGATKVKKKAPYAEEIAHDAQEDDEQYGLSRDDVRAKCQIPVGILQNSEFCQKLLTIRPQPHSDVLFFFYFY